LIACTALAGLVTLLVQNHESYLRRLDYWRTGSVEIEGLTFHLNPDDEVISEIMVDSGTWEATETAVIRRLLRPGDTFIDIGANIGYYTVVASKVVGDAGQVIAFDPDPVSFELLKRNVEENDCKNVTLLQKALSSEPGTLKLFLNESNKGAHRIFDRSGEKEFVEVEAMRLDDYLEAHSGEIQLIKIDTEGAEGLILMGMRETLRRHQEVNVLMEFAPKLLNDSSVGAREVLTEVSSLGFKILDIDEYSGRLVPTTTKRLLETHSPDEFSYTNLLLWRQPSRIESLKRS